MRRVAVIIGAGPGLGGALAQALSKTHHLLLLSRSLPGSLPALKLKIPEDKLIAASSDGSRSTLDAAMKQVKEKWSDGVVDVGIFNTGGKFAPGHFLEGKEEDLRENVESSIIGAYNLGQTLIPLMLANTSDSKGTLIFTGATMSMRGGALFSNLAPSMFGRRALSQSLAREFGPQSIHVAHVIVDGMIDTPTANEKTGPDRDGKRLKPEDIAQTYLAIIHQPKSAWTQELDLRPFGETF